MKRQAYESSPLPIDWKKYEYLQGNHEAAYIFNEDPQPWLVGDILDRIKSDNVADKRLDGYSFEMDNIPTYRIAIPVDTAAVLASGLVKSENAGWLAPYLLIDLGDLPDSTGQATAVPKKYLVKQEMMILDMLKNNADWSRPMYYAITVGTEMYMRLDPYFRQDGAAYRIMPFHAKYYQPVDSDVLYDNVMNKYKYGNLSQKGLYLDENSSRMARTFRSIFGELVTQLAADGDTVRAEKALDYCLEVIPTYNVPFDYLTSYRLADAYHAIGRFDKAIAIYAELASTSAKTLNWYNRLDKNSYGSVLEDAKREIYFLQNELTYLYENAPDEYAKYAMDWQNSVKRYQDFARKGKRGGANL
jgi:tetratricopeptide (TPR) repeat protein